MPDVSYAILVQGDPVKLHAFEKEIGYNVLYSSGNIASINANASAIAQLLERAVISYAELPQHHIQAMNDTMVVRNRIKPVKTGAFPLTQTYNGNGILLGLIDTGIDISHKDFKDAQGNSRIRFLWDQAATSGPSAPAPFTYGVEWTDADINANLCTHSDMPHYGHGTHVSGIAAGNGLANGTHQGCASLAGIIMVAMDFNSSGPTTADAVQYILSKATALGKPCVINSSLGDYYGSHDGTDLEAKLIESMVTNVPGCVMVAAAGNGGNLKYHVRTQANGTDTSFTWLHNGGAAEDYWLYGDSSQVKNLQISVGANRSNFSNLGRIAFHPSGYGFGPVKHDTLKHNGNRIAVIDNSSSINNYGVYELYIHITADTSNLLWRIETAGTGLHHAWNFDFVSTGLPTQSQYPAMSHYIAPDTMYSLVSSYQCSDEIITVANYYNLKHYYDVNDTLRTLPEATGSLAETSSSGPTRDGRQKPDISATGNAVFSCLVAGMQASQIANNPKSVAQGSLHVIGGGTSAASPVVAGLAALYLEAHPTATNRQVKRAITHCAYSDQFTGTQLPNYAWGYGKLDGLAAMVCEENLVGLSSISSSASANYFPNPFTNRVTIEVPQAISANISVYLSDGQLIYSDQFEGTRYQLEAPVFTRVSPGLLFVKITGNNIAYAFKVIHE